MKVFHSFDRVQPVFHHTAQLLLMAVHLHAAATAMHSACLGSHGLRALAV